MKPWHQQLKSYKLKLKLEVEASQLEPSINFHHIVLYTTSFSTSFLGTARLVIATSAYCWLCLIVPECSCFISPNGGLFITMGQVNQQLPTPMSLEAEWDGLNPAYLTWRFRMTNPCICIYSLICGDIGEPLLILVVYLTACETALPFFTLANCCSSHEWIFLKHWKSRSTRKPRVSCARDRYSVVSSQDKHTW